MITPLTIQNVLGQRGLYYPDYADDWTMINRLDGQGNVIWTWDTNALGPEPNQAELSLATNPLINLIVTPNENGVIATAQVTNSNYQGSVSWRCVAPDGTIYLESDNMSAGSDNWEIDMGALGNYTIAAWVTGYGYAEEIYNNG